MDNAYLQRWALLTEILGAAAVVFSLLFLGFQVRQSSEETALNTKAVQTGAYQELIRQLEEVNVLLIENPELMRIRLKALSGEKVADINEIALYRTFLRIVCRHSDMAFYQFMSGLIDEEQFLGMLGPLRSEVPSNEAGKDLWDSMTVARPADSNDYVNKNLFL